VSENRVLKKIFGPNKDEVTGDLRKLRNEELRGFYCSVNQMQEDETGGRVVRMGEKRNAYRVLVGKPEGKRQLVRSTRRWEENIKTDIREI
jgi:hypothetical protein